MAFVFQGIEPFVRRVVESAGRNHRDHSTILRSEPVDRVGQALSQASLASPGARAAVAAGSLEWREVLLLSLRVVEMAIVETYAELGLPAPEFQDVRSVPMAGPGPGLAPGTEPGEPPAVVPLMPPEEPEEAIRRRRR